MKDTMHLVAAIAAMSAAVAASADTFTLKDGAGDWTVAASYVENAVPVAGDTVNIPADAAVTVADDASFALVDSLDRVFLGSTASTVVLDVPEGKTNRLGCRLRGSSLAASGLVVKRGPGELVLTNAVNDVLTASVTVEAGTLTLPQDYGTGVRGPWMNVVTVSNGATLVTAADSAGSAASDRGVTGLNELWGEGVVTHRKASPSKVLQVYENHSSTFAGAIGAAIRLMMYGELHLTGTNSSFSASPYITSSTSTSINGVLGLQLLGNRADPTSSVGSVSNLEFRTGGTLIYLGDGETSDKIMNVRHTYRAPAVFDGAAYGGLTLAGPVALGSTADKYYYFSQLHLTGSNTVPCTIAGPINNISHGSTNYEFSITKTGTGTWRILDNALTTHGGGWAVDEGRLQIDSLTERGIRSALGFSTNLHVDASSLSNYELIAETNVAVTLGGEATEGTLEYIGANAAGSTTRLIDVRRGGGRIFNSGSAALSVHGMEAAPGESATLTVGGSGTAFTNRVSGLSDGNGTLSLAKDGDDTWVLAGGNGFTGSLSVKAGTLIVHDPARYEYFRWTIRQNYGGFLNQSTSWHDVGAREFGIYDEDGNRMNGRLLQFTSYTDYGASCLPEGCVAYQRSGGFSEAGTAGSKRSVQSLFDDDVNVIAGCASWWDVTMIPNIRIDPENPATWLPVVMHVTNGTSRASSFDFIHAFSDGAKGRRVWAYTIEGSADGVSYDMLANVTSTPSATNTDVIATNTWTFSGTTYATGSGGTHTGGAPIAGGPTGAAGAMDMVSSVSVAPGAWLVGYEGMEVPSLSLSADGAGTFEGCTFPESGVIDVTCWTNRQTGALSATFVNCTGLENLKGWTLKSDGEETTSRSVTVWGGKLFLNLPGAILIVR